MSGPVETELPSDFRRREKLRLGLTLHRSISEPDDLKDRIKSITSDELARKIRSSNKSRPFLLLDCRGYLCYTESHIQGAVHIACTDRFNRKRVQNSDSVLDLVSTNRRNAGPGSNKYGKWTGVIVYDEGTSDLNEEAGWQTPMSFVLMHLLQENRQPIYLKGGYKEFTRYYKDLCDTSNSNANRAAPNALSLSPSPMSATTPTSLLFPSPLSALPPLSPVQPMSTPNYVERYENEPPTEVLPFLYVGNARDSSNRKLLKELGIRYILSVTTHTPSQGQGINDVTNTSTNTNTKGSLDELQCQFRTKWIPVSDNLSENLAPHFDDACNFIEEARQSGEKILIHCHAGISRSPTIAIAYIMKYINLSTLEAYAFVQRSRKIISPNLNFMGQLVEFESKLKGSSSETESSTESSSSLDTSTNSSSSISNSNRGISNGGTCGSGSGQGGHHDLSVSPMIIAD